MLPVLSWKVVESKQHLAILGQAGHGFVVLGPILGDEAVEGVLGCLAVLSFVDGVQILLGLALQGWRQLVQHVGDLVHPAPLLPGLGPDLVQRLPEAQRPVAGGELGIEHEPVLVTQAEQQLTPALGALAKAVLDGQQLLPAAGVGADQHQQALPLVLEPGREVDAVGPEIDVAPGREVAALPARVLLLPALGQPAHGRRRQARCAGPEQGGERFRHPARRHPLQVEPGQELLEVPGPPQVGRQDRRAEPDRLAARGSTAVADLGPAHLERADAGLDLPLGGMPVAHQATTTLLVQEPGMAGKERLDLGLDRLHQHPPGAIPQHGQQRVVGDARSWSRPGHNAILVHGVSSRVTSTITEDTPPPIPATKFGYSSGRTRSRFSFSVLMNRSAQPSPSGSRTNAGELSMPRKRISAWKSWLTYWLPWSWRSRRPAAMPLAKPPWRWRTACLTGSRAWKRSALRLAWMPTHSVEQWSTVMNTAAWPSPVMTEVRSVPHMTSTRSVVIVPSWAREPRGRPARWCVNRAFSRMSRRSRRRLLRMQANRSRGHSLQ